MVSYFKSVLYSRLGGASLLPGSAGLPPSLTIMALPRKAADKVKAAL